VPPFDKDPDVFQNESILLSKLGNNDDALAKAEIARQLAPDDEKIVRTRCSFSWMRRISRASLTAMRNWTTK
jgi:hypothetical protein